MSEIDDFILFITQKIIKNEYNYIILYFGGKDKFIMEMKNVYFYLYILIIKIYSTFFGILEGTKRIKEDRGSRAILNVCGIF